MKRALKILSMVLYFGMLIAAIVMFFHFQTKDFASAIGTFLDLTILLYFVRKKYIPEHYFLLAVMVFWLDFLGNFWIFWNVPYYDKIIHLLVPGVASYMVYNLIKNKKYKFLITFLVVLGGAGIWEIYEYISDIFFHTQLQGVFDAAGNMIMSRIDDTMIDLITGTLGSLIYLTYKKVREFVQL